MVTIIYVVVLLVMLAYIAGLVPLPWKRQTQLQATAFAFCKDKAGERDLKAAVESINEGSRFVKFKNPSGSVVIWLNKGLPDACHIYDNDGKSTECSLPKYLFSPGRKIMKDLRKTYASAIVLDSFFAVLNDR